jgi:hypothetical protein
MIYPGNELVSSPTGVSRLNLGPSVLLAEPCPSPTVASFEEWMSTLKSNKLRTRGQNSLNHRLAKVERVQYVGFNSRLEGDLRTKPQ